MTKVPSQEELNDLKKFVDAHKAELPATTVDVLLRVLSIYAGFLQSAQRAKNTLSRLREAMGITPKSERGGRDKDKPDEQTVLALENLSPEQQALLAVLEKKRDLALKQKSITTKKSAV